LMTITSEPAVMAEPVEMRRHKEPCIRRRLRLDTRALLWKTHLPALDILNAIREGQQRCGLSLPV